MSMRRSSPASPFTSATDILRQIVDTKMVTLFSVVVIISISLVIGCKEEDTTFTILTGYVFRDPASIITTQVNRLRLIQSKVIWGTDIFWTLSQSKFNQVGRCCNSYCDEGNLKSVAAIDLRSDENDHIQAKRGMSVLGQKALCVHGQFPNKRRGKWPTEGCRRQTMPPILVAACANPLIP